MILVAAEVTKLLILPLRFLLMIVFSYINIAIAMYVVTTDKIHEKFSCFTS